MGDKGIRLWQPEDKDSNKKNKKLWLISFVKTVMRKIKSIFSK